MARPARVPPELTCGPFTLLEARQAGLTVQRLRGASWRRLGPASYAWAGVPMTPRLSLGAISRRLPEGAAFSGRTAAWLHGLDVPPDDPIEVTIPDGLGISALVGAKVSRSRLDASDVVVRQGLPVTSILRTLADLAWRLPLIEAIVIADMALHARRVDLDQLCRYAADLGPRRGVIRLRQVVALAEPLAESPMETRLRLLLQLSGLPRPQAQVSVFDATGDFLGRVDLYYPAQRLVIEYDGGGHRERPVADDRRQNRLLEAGFRMLRFTAADVLGNSESVVAQVRAALNKG